VEMISILNNLFFIINLLDKIHLNNQIINLIYKKIPLLNLLKKDLPLFKKNISALNKLKAKAYFTIITIYKKKISCKIFSQSLPSYSSHKIPKFKTPPTIFNQSLLTNPNPSKMISTNTLSLKKQPPKNPPTTPTILLKTPLFHPLI
jgi:hypothetical protein